MGTSSNLRPPRFGIRLSCGTALAIASLVSACSSDVVDDDADERPRTEEEKAAYRVVESFCGTARTCCNAAGIETPELEDCEAVAFEELSEELALSRGNVQVRQSQLDECLEAIEALGDSCDWDGDDLPVVCAMAFVGMLDEGDPCQEEIECGGGQACVFVTPANGPDPELGTCRAMTNAGEGGDCSWTFSGPPGRVSIFVDSSTEPELGYCREEEGLICGPEAVCVPPPGEGEPCAGDCAVGLYCNFAVTPAVCAAQKATDSTCEEDDECLEGACDEITFTCTDQVLTSDSDLCEAELDP